MGGGRYSASSSSSTSLWDRRIRQAIRSTTAIEPVSPSNNSTHRTVPPPTCVSECRSTSDTCPEAPQNEVDLVREGIPEVPRSRTAGTDHSQLSSGHQRAVVDGHQWAESDGRRHGTKVVVTASCSVDIHLCHRVQVLLSKHGVSGGLLPKPGVTTPIRSARCGRRTARRRLRRAVGAGGADRSSPFCDPGFGRRSAVPPVILGFHAAHPRFSFDQPVRAVLGRV
jgi:hypothetical protein